MHCPVVTQVVTLEPAVGVQESGALIVVIDREVQRYLPFLAHHEDPGRRGVGRSGQEARTR